MSFPTNIVISLNIEVFVNVAFLYDAFKILQWEVLILLVMCHAEVYPLV